MGRIARLNELQREILNISDDEEDNNSSKDEEYRSDDGGYEERAPDDKRASLPPHEYNQVDIDNLSTYTFPAASYHGPNLSPPPSAKSSVSTHPPQGESSAYQTEPLIPARQQWSDIDEMPVATKEQDDITDVAIESNRLEEFVLVRLKCYKDFMKMRSSNMEELIRHQYDMINSDMWGLDSINAINEKTIIIQKKIKMYRELVEYCNKEIKALANEFYLNGFSVSQSESKDKLTTRLTVPEKYQSLFQCQHDTSSVIELESIISEMLSHREDSSEANSFYTGVS